MRSIVRALAIVAALAAPTTAASAAPSASDWSLRTSEGGEAHFSEALAEGPVLVSFWALWCRPCLIELPHIDALAREMKGRMTVFAVNIDSPKSVAKVRPFLKSKGYEVIVPLDTAGEVSRLLQVGKTVPFLVLYDANGKEAYRHVGYKEGDEKELRERVMSLLVTSADSSSAPGTE